ncbi:MAG: tetratricopeptide repeat protein [Deltaproteobacteria bacterium]|nr:tetratricopeptide repeat protein [Deltaproteobacteria bacterium]
MIDITDLDHGFITDIQFFELINCDQVTGTLWWEAGTAREHVIQTSEEYLEKAIEFDDRSCEAHMGLTLLNCFKRKFNTAIDYGRKAIELSPNNAMAYMFYGYSLFLAGESEKALPLLNKSFRLDPIPSNIAYVQRGEIYFDLKDYDRAVNDFQKIIESEPDDIWARMGLVASFQRLGLKEKASSQVKKIMALDPNFSLEAQVDPGEKPNSPKVSDYWNALREAGLS